LDNRSVDIQSFYKTTVFTRRLPEAAPAAAIQTAIMAE
jgi:hypothetical protein